MSVNKCIIIGFLGQDPKMNYSQSGMAICKFSIATNDVVRKGEQETSWHNCVSFGKAAEVIEKYVKKGNELYVEGRIKYGKYTNKAGLEVKTTDIIVNNFQFLGGKKQSVEASPDKFQSEQDDIPF